jgi:hypothetical protein
MERLAFVEQHFEIVAAEPAAAPRHAFVCITFASELPAESMTYNFFAEGSDD